MPLVRLQVTTSLSEEKRKELLGSLSKILTESIGKPERYVMAIVDTASIIMSGKHNDAAFADVRSIGGLNGKVNAQIAQKICTLLDTSLAIPADRVYINFTDVAASNWGWNSSTFG